MNQAIFRQWVRDRVEELVSFGVSRDEAEELMHTLELGAVANEAQNRCDDQFLLDLKRLGRNTMAERIGKSPSLVSHRRRLILQRRQFNSSQD